MIYRAFIGYLWIAVPPAICLITFTVFIFIGTKRREKKKERNKELKKKKGRRGEGERREERREEQP
jgi:hypothetical protein